MHTTIFATARRTFSSRRRQLAALAMLLAFAGNKSFAAPAPVATATTIGVSSGTVTSGTAVTLTATVLAGSTPVTPGLVIFCDASATSCQGSAVLGTAQLITTGTASIKFTPGIGSHSVKAIFVGTTPSLPSVSTAQSITVTGASPTVSVLTDSGAAGNYTLTSTVGYQGLVTPDTNETVNFIDTTNNNLSLGTGTIGTPSAPVYSFEALTSSIASGIFPVAVISGDFNGDGFPDLAVANYLDNTVSVYAGNGSGGYTPVSGSPFSVGAGPSALAVADFNSDGHPDLAVVNANDGTITILIGDGSGHFTSAGAFSTLGNGPQAFAVADFNDDGWPDIAVANLFSSTITVLLNDGTGQFTPTPDSPILGGGNPSSIVAVDFDGDGQQDLAVANTYDGTVSFLAGNGDGTFSVPTGSTITVPAGPSSLAIVDFDGDGRPDLAVASGSGNTLSVILNKQGGPVVVPGSPFTTGDSPAGVITGDFNGDGIQDIAVPNANSSNVTIFLGDGLGGFTAAPGSPLDGFNSPSAIALADVNGDGRRDLVLTNLGSNTISLLPEIVTQTAAASLASVSVFGGGQHVIQATYGGDSSYGASVSNTITLEGSLITTSTSLFSGGSVPYLSTAQLTASVTPDTADNYNASGTVAFVADGSNSLGTGTLTSGQAAISVNTLSVGTHSLKATYSGDTNFATSFGSGSITITQAGTATTLSSTLANLSPGTAVTFTAGVASLTSGTPTGSVTFYDGTLALGSTTLSGGVASYTTSALATGTHSITAVYNGDTNYSGSTSNPVTETVSDFTLSSANPSLTVLPGAAADFTISVTPIGSFDDPITFTATGLPAGATATFSPVSVTPGAIPTSVELIVTTSKQLALNHSSKHWGTSAPAAAFALLLLPFCVGKRRRKSFLRITLLLLFTAGAAAGISGCSGGFFNQPAETYSIVVTGTSGTLQHTTTVTLTVQ